ncbi:MAG: hypothetical protein ACRDOI_11430 [Trebonia sp.]
MNEDDAARARQADVLTGQTTNPSDGHTAPETGPKKPKAKLRSRLWSDMASALSGWVASILTVAAGHHFFPNVRRVVVDLAVAALALTAGLLLTLRERWKRKHGKPRIGADIEKPFRDALEHALRNEHEEMFEVLLRLNDEQIASCLDLCATVSGYIAIDVCGRQWPDEDNLRRIGEATTESSNARAFGLKAEDSYAYVKRVALRGEPLNTVLSPLADAATLSFVITGHLLVAFRPADQHWWEYLNKIETAYEAAQTVDLDLLPALILRPHRPTPPSAPEATEVSTHGSWLSTPGCLFSNLCRRR